jgi:isocitrate dehydrogenase
VARDGAHLLREEIFQATREDGNGAGNIYFDELFRLQGRAAVLINKAVDGAFASKTVTYDISRVIEGATQVKCSEFGDAVIAHM